MNLFGFGRNDDPNTICGGRHESYMEECKNVIESKNINSFSYSGNINFYERGYALSAKKDGDKVYVSASGGGMTNKRDGKYFIVKFESDDLSILNELQKIIDDNNVVSDNGHCTHVDGLPGGLGDNIDVTYDSGERLYKISNQCPTISEKASQGFYEAFHKYVVKHGFDFTSEGSNVKLYDDADEEYLQGTWNGKHFGSEISVTFNGKRVTITVDGKQTDDEEYTIYEGTVVKNKLKEGIENPSSYSDYEYFNGVSEFKKKNWFTMTGYFLSESYSTCDLMNFDKEKPKEEKD